MPRKKKEEVLVEASDAGKAAEVEAALVKSEEVLAKKH